MTLAGSRPGRPVPIPHPCSTDQNLFLWRTGITTDLDQPAGSCRCSGNRSTSVLFHDPVGRTRDLQSRRRYERNDEAVQSSTLIKLASHLTESAAPSSALPIGKQRILSATRLTRVNPAASPNIHRLQNAILGLVMVSDEDKRTDLPPRKVKEVKKEEVKQEGDIKEEVKAEEGDEEEEEEEEEPIWKEEIGWREVCGFLTM